MGLISEAISRYISSTREVREGPQAHWYPSQIGGCERQAVLKRAGVRGADFDDRTLRVFWMGDEVHAGLQKAVASGLPEGYSLVGHELRVRDADYHVSGRLDTLVRRPDGELEVIEYKSTRTKAFGYGDLPKPEHILQLGIYGTFPSTCQECKNDTTEPRGKEALRRTEPREGARIQEKVECEESQLLSAMASGEPDRTTAKGETSQGEEVRPPRSSAAAEVLNLPDERSELLRSRPLDGTLPGHAMSEMQRISRDAGGREPSESNELCIQCEGTGLISAPRWGRLVYW